MSKNEHKVHEPLFHIAKRDKLSGVKSLVIRIISVLVALVACGILIVALTGENPISVYATMIDGAVGTSRRFWNLLQGTAILLCISLAVTPAFKMRFWNIGAEGQVLIGGLATAYVMMFYGDRLSTPLLFLVIIVACIAAGALWAIIPAIFKAFFNTNETLFTLMMNYIAIQLVSYFAYVNSNPAGSGTIGLINSNTQTGWLPKIGDNSYLINILIVAALTVIMYIYLRYSKHGYELTVVGESENTANYIGINVRKVIIRTVAISGALCGIAGMLLVSGTDHTITSETAGGRGFTAIIVSWLGKFNPIYMVVTSLLIVFLEKGATRISTVFELNSSFSDIITGIIIFFIIGSEFFINYQIKFNHSHKEGK